MNSKESINWLKNETENARSFPEPHKKYVVLAILKARWAKPEYVINSFLAELYLISPETYQYWITDIIEKKNMENIEEFLRFEKMVDEEMQKT